MVSYLIHSISKGMNKYYIIGKRVYPRLEWIRKLSCGQNLYLQLRVENPFQILYLLRAFVKSCHDKGVARITS